jgi:predicted transcriptional regulator
METDPTPAPWAERLLSFIQQYPGVHLREIRRRLGIPIGTLDYHLYRMGRAGIITVQFQGGYKCCYPAVVPEIGGPIPEVDRKVLALLRLPAPRALLLHLYLEGPTPPASLGTTLGTSGPNLSYYLHKLEESKVVVREGQGAQRLVRLVDPKQVHRLLLQFPPLPETAVDRFLRFWSELHP